MGSLAIVTRWKARESPGAKKERERERDYRNYRFSGKEECRCLMEGMVLIGLLAYFFYRSVLAFLCLSPILFFYQKYKKKRMVKRRMEELEKEFREVLLSVTSSLQAGYSVENAFLESYRDISGLFGTSCDMAKELLIMKKGMENGMGMEQLLHNLGSRCPEGEIKEFVEVFSVAMKSGGRIGEVIKRTVDLIREKAEIKEELETLVHAKQMENRIMCMVPFFILLYINLTSPGYFDVLYHNVVGVVIMTICMLLYLAAVCMADRITQFGIE